MAKNKTIRLIGNNASGEQVTVTIRGGKATIATSGFQGASCLSATAGLEAALGVTQSDTPTEEMHVAPVEQTLEQS